MDGRLRHAKSINSASFYSDETGFFYITDSGDQSESYETLELAIEECYIQLARDEYGSAVRDNSRAELIKLGQIIDLGEVP